MDRPALAYRLEIRRSQVDPGIQLPVAGRIALVCVAIADWNARPNRFGGVVPAGPNPCTAHLGLPAAGCYHYSRAWLDPTRSGVSCPSQELYQPGNYISVEVQA